MAKRARSTARSKPRKRSRPAKRKRPDAPVDTPTAVKAAEKKIDALEHELDRAKAVTTAVLDEELDRSKQIASEVRDQLKKIRRRD